MVGAVGMAILFALPNILEDLGHISAGIYTGALLLLLVEIGWFSFSHVLLKNRNNDFEGVKKLIKIGSYIIGYLEAVSSGSSVVVGGILLSFDIIRRLGLTIIVGVFLGLGGLFLILVCFLLHGIRTNSPGKIKIWTISSLVCILLFLPFQ